MKRLSEWRLTEAGFYRLLLALMLVLVSALMSRAQPPEPTPEGEDAEVSELETAPLSPIVQAALNSINDSDTKTPAELMTAVSRLQQLGAYEDANTFLDRVVAQNLDDEALTAMHGKVGTGALFRLANDKEMPAAREFVSRVFAAVRAVKRDPVRLQKMIEQLANKDDEMRRLAMRELRAAGADAVPPLLSAMRLPAAVPTEYYEAALRSLGGEAEDALIAALGSPDPFVQSIACRGLGSIGTKRAVLHLIRPYFVGQTYVQPAARHALRRMRAKQPSSFEGSVATLAKITKEHLHGRTPFTPDIDDTLEMWTWSAERKNVVKYRLGAREAAALTAARLARDVYEMSPTSEHSRLMLVAQLESDQLLGGIDELLRQGPGSAYELGKARGIAAVSDAMEYSMKHRHDAAAIGAAEVLSALSNTAAGASMHWTPLVKALQSPSRRVRHAAARAVMELDPRYRFAGASFFVEALVDLADVSGAPGALICTPREDVRSTLAGTLGGLGFSVRQTSRPQPFLAEAMRSSDYDLLLLSDSVNRPIAYEVLQQLRKDPQTKDLPVIILARQGRAERTRQLAELDDLAVVIPEFADQETLKSELAIIEKMVAKTTVPPSQRLNQARDALEWLGHLAQYSQTYPWYDVMRAEKVGTQAVGSPELMAPAINLLGYLGGEPSQKMLIEIASMGVHSPENRTRAANSFAEAVLRRGVMLREAAVNQQYDRYNASEELNRETQEILGQVLDVIESQTKPTSIEVAK